MDAPRPAPLSPEAKRALLAELLQRKLAGPSANGHAAAPPTPPPLRPAPRDQPLPLSFGQETLWFLDQLEPGGTAYNCCAAVRLTGPLDAEALRQAFERIVHRHEALRSTFKPLGERRVVEILPPAPLPMPVTDLGGLSPAEREARVKELADREARQPFDLLRGPMLRLALLRLTDEDH